MYTDIEIMQRVMLLIIMSIYIYMLLHFRSISISNIRDMLTGFRAKIASERS